MNKSRRNWLKGLGALSIPFLCKSVKGETEGATEKEYREIIKSEVEYPLFGRIKKVTLGGEVNHEYLYKKGDFDRYVVLPIDSVLTIVGEKAQCRFMCFNTKMDTYKEIAANLHKFLENAQYVMGKPTDIIGAEDKVILNGNVFTLSWYELGGELNG